MFVKAILCAIACITCRYGLCSDNTNVFYKDTISGFALEKVVSDNRQDCAIWLVTQQPTGVKRLCSLMENVTNDELVGSNSWMKLERGVLFVWIRTCVDWGTLKVIDTNKCPLAVEPDSYDLDTIPVRFKSGLLSLGYGYRAKRVSVKASAKGTRAWQRDRLLIYLKDGKVRTMKVSPDIVSMKTTGNVIYLLNSNTNKRERYTDLLVNRAGDLVLVK